MRDVLLTTDGPNGSRAVTGVYLRVFETQFTSQLLPVWLTDVLLLLEGSLQGLPLQVGEHCPAQHAPPGLPSGGQGPREGSRDRDHRRGGWRDITGSNT